MCRTLMNKITDAQLAVYSHLHAIKILPVENKYLQIYYKKLLVHLVSHRIEIFGAENLLFGLSQKNISFNSANSILYHCNII